MTAAAAPARFASLVARCFLPFAAAYFLSYLYRSVNAVIGPELVREMALDAAALGVLTSAYFAAFAAFQLPLGILLDRYGPRRVESALLLSAAIGALLFAIAENVATLTLGRALIGLGVSSCLMASLKANVQFWPAARLPLANGCIMAFGGLGATVATLPVQLVLGLAGWRGIFLVLVVLTIGAVAYLYLAVPERGGGPGGESLGEQVRAVGKIYRSGLFWRVVPVTVGAQAAFLAYQGLWAGPWLSDVARFDPTATASVLFVMAATMIPGFATSGPVYGLLLRRGLTPITSLGVMMGTFIAVQIVLVLRLVPSETAMWALFCLTGSWTVVTFAYLNQNFPLSLAGRVNTALNVLVFVCAFAIQAGVGAIISLFPAVDGHFAPAGHHAALWVTIALQLAGFIWFLLPRRV